MKAETYLLLMRELEGELSAEEAEEAARLLRTSATARRERDDLRALRALVAAEGGGSFSPSFTDDVIRRLRAAGPRTTDRNAAAFRPVRGIPHYIPWSLAAAVLLLLGAGLFLWIRPETAAAPRGTTVTVTLPEGSTVELAPGAELRYRPFWGRAERRVQLSGEAFFEVARGARPFVVETFNARVVVLGTRFNVRAWPGDPERATAVTLASGRVEVVPRAPGGRALVLTPGETSLVVGDSVVARAPDRVPLERALAWRSGGLAFVDQPLPSVLRALERRYDVEIALQDPALARLSLSYLNPRPGTAEDILSDLGQAWGFRYRRTANGYLVQK